MDNNNQIEKFDPSTLMQGVKDRIKATFVSLIPDDQWEIMVQKEVDAFFNSEETLVFAEKDKYKDGSWSPTKYATLEIKQSPFRALVWEHCKEMTYTILKEKVNKEYYSDVWNGNGYDIKEGMKEVISEAAPLAAAKFFEAISFGMANDLRNKIMNNH